MNSFTYSTAFEVCTSSATTLGYSSEMPAPGQEPPIPEAMLQPCSEQAPLDLLAPDERQHGDGFGCDVTYEQSRIPGLCGAQYDVQEVDYNSRYSSCHAATGSGGYFGGCATVPRFPGTLDPTSSSLYNALGDAPQAGPLPVSLSALSPLANNFAPPPVDYPAPLPSYCRASSSLYNALGDAPPFPSSAPQLDVPFNASFVSGLLPLDFTCASSQSRMVSEFAEPLLHDVAVSQLYAPLSPSSSFTSDLREDWPTEDQSLLFHAPPTSTFSSPCINVSDIPSTPPMSSPSTSISSLSSSSPSTPSSSSDCDVCYAGSDTSDPPSPPPTDGQPTSRSKAKRGGRKRKEVSSLQRLARAAVSKTALLHGTNASSSASSSSSSSSAAPSARSVGAYRRPVITHLASRVAQVAGDTIPPPAKVAPRRWGCRHCDFTSRLKQDVHRHIATHFAHLGNRPVCCGVLVARDDPRALARPQDCWEDDAQKVWFGGCWRDFSRDDALKRHLMNPNGKCCKEQLLYL